MGRKGRVRPWSGACPCTLLRQKRRRNTAERQANQIHDHKESAQGNLRQIPFNSLQPPRFQILTVISNRNHAAARNKHSLNQRHAAIRHPYSVGTPMHGFPGTAPHLRLKRYFAVRLKSRGKHDCAIDHQGSNEPQRNIVATIRGCRIDWLLSLKLHRCAAPDQNRTRLIRTRRSGQRSNQHWGHEASQRWLHAPSLPPSASNGTRRSDSFVECHKLTAAQRRLS
jgi:hypothetical protein